MPARNLCRGVRSRHCLHRIAGYRSCGRGEGLERGLGYRQVDKQKSVHRGRDETGIAKDADVYGSGFIYESNRLRGKNANCVIKTQKQDGDVMYLVTLCTNDVTLGRVQFSLKIHDDNQITRFFPGVSELDTKYYRCSS